MTFLLTLADVALLWVARWLWRLDRDVRWSDDDQTAYEVVCEAHRDGAS